jgi:uncharacterized surface protein with fasciclin (FAS1) repeats
VRKKRKFHAKPGIGANNNVDDFLNNETKGGDAMKDIYATLAANGTMLKLVGSIKKAGLVETLQGAGPFTLFAPDDDAFTRMDFEKELNDPDKLKSVLTYHLVSGKYTAADIAEMETLGTVNGKSLTIALDEGDVVIDNGKFVKTDIECSNGIVHIIDNVFQPHLSGWYREE